MVPSASSDTATRRTLDAPVQSPSVLGVLPARSQAAPLGRQSNKTPDRSGRLRPGYPVHGASEMTGEGHSRKTGVLT